LCSLPHLIDVLLRWPVNSRASLPLASSLSMVAAPSDVSRGPYKPAAPSGRRKSRIGQALFDVLIR